MNIVRSLMPSNTPAHLLGKNDQDISREKILQSILLIASIFVLIILLLNSMGFISVFLDLGNIVLPVLAVTILSLTFLRRLPHLLRSIPLLAIIFGIAIANFLLNGIGGIGIGFLMAFSIIVGAVLGVTAHRVSLGIVAATVFGFAWIMGRGILPPSFPIQPLDSRDFASWMQVFTLFVIIMGVTSNALGILMGDLETSLGRQTALTNELKQEKTNLELHIQERTQRLKLKAEQLRTITEINRSITSILDQEMLFQKVVDLLRDRMDLYYAGVFIIDESGQFAVLKAGTGEAGRQMVAAGHRLSVGGTSMIGWATSNRMARIALDVGEEGVRFSNPLLPDTRSELALPILNREKAVGALTIQSSAANAFDDDDILIFQGIADGLSVALENARLFQQNQQDLDEIRYLNQQYLQQSWGTLLQSTGTLASEYENPLARKDNPKTYQQIIPITLRNQEIGHITLETIEQEMSIDDQQFIDAITAQTILSLESARLLRETQSQAIQEEKLNQITARFSDAFDIKDVLETALKELSLFPAVSEISVHLIPPDTQPEIKNNGNEVIS